MTNNTNKPDEEQVCSAKHQGRRGNTHTNMGAGEHEETQGTRKQTQQQHCSQNDLLLNYDLYLGALGGAGQTHNSTKYKQIH